MQTSDETRIIPFSDWRLSSANDLEDVFVTADYDGQLCKAVFGPAALEAENTQDFDLVAHVSIGRHQVNLRFNALKCKAVLSKILPGAFLKGDGNARDLLFLTHLATPFFNRLEMSGLGPVCLDSLQPLEVVFSECERFETLELKGAGSETQGLVGLGGSHDFFATLAKALKSGEKTGGAQLRDTGQLRAEVALIAGAIELSLLDVRRLKPGQGVYLDIAPIEQGCVYVSIGNSRFLQAKIEGTSARIMSGANLKMPNDSELFSGFVNSGLVPPPHNDLQLAGGAPFAPGFQPNPASGSAVVPVGDLPLQITAEIARYELSIDEIAQLKAGSLFDIPADPKKFVTLRIGHQIIGHGEIVQAGHKLAVRITEIKA